VVVLSDDKSASRKIAQFTESGERWMVAVRMVSEGVDIPRLAVGVYATSIGTALFFAQAVGRFVRVRRRGETASVFLPSIPSLLGYAAELEAERDHVLRRPGDDDPDGQAELDEAQRRRDTADELGEAPFKPLQASAHFDRVLYDGGEFGTSAEEEDYLGLPGLLEPEQVGLLLRKRQADQLRKSTHPAGRGTRGASALAATAAGGGTADDRGAGRGTAATAAGRGTGTPAAGPPTTAAPGASPGAAAPGGSSAARAPSARETLAALRKELNLLITAWHHRTGQPHAVIHADLRRACGGPSLPEATGQQIRARIDTIRRWASAGR
jgi:hypothetical protein